MNERDRMEDFVLRGRLMVGGIKPDMAHLSDICGEYLVVFDYPAGNTKAERLTVKFHSRKARDEWWKQFKTGFDI